MKLQGHFRRCVKSVKIKASCFDILFCNAKIIHVPPLSDTFMSQGLILIKTKKVNLFIITLKLVIVLPLSQSHPFNLKIWKFIIKMWIINYDDWTNSEINKQRQYLLCKICIFSKTDCPSTFLKKCMYLFTTETTDSVKSLRWNQLNNLARVWKVYFKRLFTLSLFFQIF